MMAMVDENGDGEISREEWQEAISFYVKQMKGFDPTDPNARRGNNRRASVMDLFDVQELELTKIETPQADPASDADIEVGSADLNGSVVSGLFIESEKEL